MRPTNDARAALAAGTNLLLADPRRMGKTQWLRHLARVADEYTTVLINYEGTRTAEEFLTRTASELAKSTTISQKFRSALSTWFSGIDSIDVGVVKVHNAVGTQSSTDLLAQLVTKLDESSAGGKPVLVLMDEVPMAVRNITVHESPESGKALLQVLRRLRQSTRNVRWIVCGSIGFHHVLRDCGATEGEINDLQNLPLGPLEDGEDDELARRLFLGIDIRDADDDTVRALIDSCGSIPFLMHKIVSALDDEKTHPTADAVSLAFEAFLDDRDDSKAVTHFLSRLDENYGDQTKTAHAILDDLARNPGGRSDADLASLPLLDPNDPDALNRVLDLLLDDHYLVQQRGRLRWRYDVLRRIWVHRRRLRVQS